MSKASLLWRSLAGNLLAEIALRVPSLVGDVWAARQLSKFDFGVWIGFRLLLSILPYLQGIVLFGLDLRYSHLVGAGDVTTARATAGAAFIGTTIESLMVGAALAVGLVSSQLRAVVTPGASAGQLASFIALLLLGGFYSAFVTHLRNRLKFSELNLGLLIGNVVGLAVLMTLVGRIGVYGCVAGQLTGNAVAIALWRRHAEISVPGGTQLVSELKALAKLGIPLLSAGAFLDGLRIAGRELVAQSSGVEALGTYGTVYIFSGIVLLSGTSSSRVLVQFLGRAEGARMPRAQQAHQYLFLPGLAVGAASSLAAYAVWVGAQIVIPIWTPRQIGALEVLRPAIYGAPAYAIAFLYITMLRAQGRLRALNQVTFGLFACYVAVLTTIALLHAPIWWFVTTESACFGALLLVLMITTGQSLGSVRWLFLRDLAVLFATVVGGMELAALASRGASSTMSRALIQSVVCLAAACVGMGWAWRSARRFRALAEAEVAAAPPDAIAEVARP